MKMRIRVAVLAVILLAVVFVAVRAQNRGPSRKGLFQTTNPNYPQPNPFYFEGKIDWNLLGITQPSNAWEYMEEGIHKQDDLGDITGAIQDYQTAYSMNQVANGTCQMVTASTLVKGALPSTLTPPPCIFTLRLRLGRLLSGLDSRVSQGQIDPAQAISLFQEVVGTPTVQGIDPLRLGVNALIGETYALEAEETTDPSVQQTDYQSAISAFQAELALSPVTQTETQETPDRANDAHVHWELAQIYEKLGQTTNATDEYDCYLTATQWHGDTYPWRINLAKEKVPSPTGSCTDPE
jgi:tetratricopeptide (TPR) repeat protein